MAKLSFLILCCLLLSSPARADDAADIEAILNGQAEAWSAGDIDAFMEPYWKSDELRFASGGSITYGWQETMDRYKDRYNTREKMGHLKFKDVDIKMLSDHYALAFGRFELTRKMGDLRGLFSLLWEKRPEGWRIIADHTSADEMPMVVLGQEP